MFKDFLQKKRPIRAAHARSAKYVSSPPPPPGESTSIWMSPVEVRMQCSTTAGDLGKNSILVWLGVIRVGLKHSRLVWEVSDT